MVEIIYEDEYLIVVNKPAGFLVIPTSRQENNTVTHLLNQYLADRQLTVKAHPCHRLDRDTTGILIYAKGKKNQQKMMQLFHENQVKKKYLAVANGMINQNKGIIDKKIEHKPALTEYQVIKKTALYTVLEISLLTGRTNQIRIHFKSIGHPLLGDFKFGIRKDFNIKLKSTALHASKISFPHPITQKSINLKASIPQLLVKFIE